MREVKVEKALVAAVKKRHGLCMKFTSPGLDGVPDRIVLLPHGKMAFIELKAPGKKLRPLQELRAKQLRDLGQQVFVIDNKEMIGGILDEIQTT